MMSNRSTNDTSLNTKKERIPYNLQHTFSKFKSEIEQFLLPKYTKENTNENKDLYEEIDNYCDKENEINKDTSLNKDACYTFCSKINDIKIKFIEKIEKDSNEYNLINNYDIKTDSIINKTYLVNKRKNFSEEEISNECYKLKQKMKLREDMLIIISVKGKDNILILLIKEKKIREENDGQEDKYEDEDEENKYFIYIPDAKYHVFYKKYYFRLEIPQVGENFSASLLNKNGKEEIILYFWHEALIYYFNIKNINDDCYSIKTKYTLKLDFKPKYICSIKIIIENKKYLSKKNEVNFTEFIMIITKENNLKICSYVEEMNLLYICNIGYEYENEDDKISIEGKNINHVEHLDNGLIAIHFKDEKQKDKIANFYLNCKN